MKFTFIYKILKVINVESLILYNSFSYMQFIRQHIELRFT